MEKKEFIKEVNRVMTEIKAPKNQYNKFGGFKYRSCEDIVEGAKKVLAGTGLIMNLSDEVVLVGNRFYVKATAMITDGENEVVSYGFAREEDAKKGMDSSQVTGASSSYARKYALNGLFGIDDTKQEAISDPDSLNNKESGDWKTEVANAKTIDDLMGLWKKYPSLQKDPEFGAAFTAKKNEISK